MVTLIRNSAKALIIRDGCLLVMRMQDERGVFFILPGGGQEPGETLAQAVRRECAEELGARVEVHELRFIREYIGPTHQVEFIFRCKLISEPGAADALVPDTGQLGFDWLPLSRLMETLFYPLGLRPLLDGAPAADQAIYLGHME